MIHLSSKNIILRALEPGDLEFLFQTENDRSFWEISSTQIPYSKHILSQYIANAHLDIYEIKQLRLIIEKDRKQIGMIDLFDFNPQHKRAGVGILLLNEYQGNGWANEALQIFIKYAFSDLQLHQLYANILTQNKKSITLFTKNNFKQIGIKKDWILSNNQFKDEYLFQLINTSN
jgi:diamine N-acetyltransferase